jgi:GTP-binding protein
VKWKRLIGQVDFLGSFPRNPPPAELPEVAFVGRSNVGKSSAINALLGRKHVARVSGTPGRTQAINLFRVGGSICFADLPGYGFAKVPPKVRQAWKRLIAGYLYNREGLCLVVQLVDARHEAQKADIEMVDLLQDADVPFIVVATKVDRVKRSKVDGQFKKIANGLGIPQKQLIAFSATDKIGVDVVWSVLLDAINTASD